MGNLNEINLISLLIGDWTAYQTVSTIRRLAVCKQVLQIKEDRLVSFSVRYLFVTGEDHRFYISEIHI